MKSHARNFPIVATTSLAASALIVCAIAFFSDRRLPHPSTFAYLLVWALLGNGLAWCLARLSPTGSRIWSAARAGIMAFVAVSGVTTIAALDHENRLPNAAAYLTEFCFSALLGCYLTDPEKIEALLTERKS